MPVPQLTHLQFLVLGTLMGGEQAGRQVREMLAKEGELKSGPGFYRFMARLEHGGFVEGWYDQKVVGGQIIKERRYKLTASGITAFEEVRNFYLSRSGLGFKGA